jgi:integrase
MKSNAPVRLTEALSDEIFPPKDFLSRDGFPVSARRKFSVRDPHSNSTYYFNLTALRASNEIAHSAYQILCRYIATRSLKYSDISLRIFRDFVAAGAEASGHALQQIDLLAIEAWRQRHTANGTRFDIAMAFVVPWLRRWVEYNEGNISEEVTAYLSDKRGQVEGQAYVALRTNDPERGALTQKEMNALTAEMSAQFEAGRISLATYALMWMFIGTGVRPIQISRMRVSDLLMDDGTNSNDLNLLIPLAKGEGAYEGTRWRVRAPTVLAEVLREYVRHYELVDSDAPLFPIRSDPSIPASSQHLATIVSRVGELLNVFSPRVDGSIPLFPYRFRYTVGTRAVELGANDHVVARILTQRSTWSAKSYRAATAGGQKAVIAALGDELDIIAKAFRGKIVTDLSDASRSGEAMALIRDFERLSGREMGACGTQAKCLQLAPIACLTCRHFEAFEDAPFEDLMTQLLAEQREESEIRIRQIYDEPIAALNELIQLTQEGGSGHRGINS